MKEVILNESQMSELRTKVLSERPWAWRTGMPFEVEVITSYKVTFDTDEDARLFLEQ